MKRISIIVFIIVALAVIIKEGSSIRKSNIPIDKQNTKADSVYAGISEMGIGNE